MLTMWLYWSAFVLVMSWVFGATVIWALDVFPTHAENIVVVVTLGIVCIVQAIALCVMGGLRKNEHNQQSYANDSDGPANTPKQKGAMHESPPTEPSADEQKHHSDEKLFWMRQIRAAWALNFITLGAAGVALVGLALVGRSISHADQGNIDANRAWIEPVGIDATGDIKGSADIAVKVYYRNDGRSPALNLQEYFFGGTVTNTSANDFDALKVGENNTCKGLVPVGGTDVFPNADGQHYISSVIYRKTIEPSVQIDMGALYLQGCFAYVTMHEEHYSWFCMIVYRNGKFASLAATNLCGDGHGAN